MVLWVLDEQGVWIPIELKGQIQRIGVNGATVEVSADVVAPIAALYPWRDRHGTMHSILFPAGGQPPVKISVNGYPLFDLMVLEDQTAITFTCAGQRCRAYFSTEARPQVVSYQPGEAEAASLQTVVCMRCKGKI